MFTRFVQWRGYDPLFDTLVVSIIIWRLIVAPNTTGHQLFVLQLNTMLLGVFLLEFLGRLLGDGYKRLMASESHRLNTLITACFTVAIVFSWHDYLFHTDHAPPRHDMKTVSEPSYQPHAATVELVLAIVRLVMYPRVILSCLPDRVLIAIQLTRRIIRRMATLSITFACISFVFAVIGVSWFGGLVTKDPDSQNFAMLSSVSYGKYNYWDLNFNDIPSALVTLFCALHVSDFDILTEGFVVVTNKYARIYFVAWYILGVLLLLNMIKSFFLTEFLPVTAATLKSTPNNSSSTSLAGTSSRAGSSSSVDRFSEDRPTPSGVDESERRSPRGESRRDGSQRYSASTFVIPILLPTSSESDQVEGESDESTKEQAFLTDPPQTRLVTPPPAAPVEIERKDWTVDLFSDSEPHDSAQASPHSAEHSARSNLPGDHTPDSAPFNTDISRHQSMRSIRTLSSDQCPEMPQLASSYASADQSDLLSSIQTFTMYSKTSLDETATSANEGIYTLPMMIPTPRMSAQILRSPSTLFPVEEETNDAVLSENLKHSRDSITGEAGRPGLIQMGLWSQLSTPPIPLNRSINASPADIAVATPPRGSPRPDSAGPTEAAHDQILDPVFLNQSEAGMSPLQSSPVTPHSPTRASPAPLPTGSSRPSVDPSHRASLQRQSTASSRYEVSTEYIKDLSQHDLSLLHLRMMQVAQETTDDEEYNHDTAGPPTLVTTGEAAPILLEEEADFEDSECEVVDEV